MARFVRAVFVLLPLVSCLGTPRPIPIPMDSKALRVTNTSGETVVTGLEGAADGAYELRVTNNRTGAEQTAPVTAGGSFAAVLKGGVGDVLLLEALGVTGAVQGSLEVTVPGATLTKPVAQMSPPDPKGLVQVTGSLVQGDQAVVAFPKTGEVQSVRPGKGQFSVTIKGVLAGDAVYAFATNEQGAVSEHQVLMLSTQSMCVDADFDGYGQAGTDLSFCASAVADCNDAEGDVNPGQTQFFSTPIPGADPSVDYDYNCDGTEEMESSALQGCSASKTCDANGWDGKVPMCGEVGTWTVCGLQTGVCGIVQIQKKPQACR
jgi:hypothetical protein